MRKKAAPEQISILIVDDSVVVRRILTHALSGEFEIRGYATSAELALEKVAQLSPDLLILDIHMPGMSGLELLPILRQRYPRLRVVLFSRSSPESISGYVDAMVGGTIDFLMKPSDDVSLGESIDSIREQLHGKIRLLFPGRSIASRANEEGLSTAQNYLPKRLKIHREVLAIGVSTGGPTALTTVLQQLPRDYHLPIVIVQHMPPVFTNLLASRIRTVTGLDIAEAVDGTSVEPGKAYLAPGNFHMRLVRDAIGVRIALDQGPMECSCRPAVDVLFRSVAEVYGGATIATVLTGMGQDGLRGVQELHRIGAHIIVQDEASSVVWGMPGAIAQAQLSHEILDINSIADAIQRQSGRRHNA
jgi:two-component system chemotaxis response regulator CheB